MIGSRHIFSFAVFNIPLSASLIRSLSRTRFQFDKVETLIVYVEYWWHPSYSNNYQAWTQVFDDEAPEFSGMDTYEQWSEGGSLIDPPAGMCAKGEFFVDGLCSSDKALLFKTITGFS